MCWVSNTRCNIKVINVNEMSRSPYALSHPMKNVVEGKTCFSIMHLRRHRARADAATKRKRGRKWRRNIVHDFKNFSRNIFCRRINIIIVGQKHFPHICMYLSIDMPERGDSLTHTYIGKNKSSIIFENARELIST